MPAPIADYLRTPLAKARGRSGDTAAVKAFTTRPRGFVRLTITYTAWAWRRNMARDANGATRRVWLNPIHWGTDRMDVPGDVALGIGWISQAWPNKPAVIPWGSSFVTGTAPAGMEADLGVLIDYDDASAKGWELLGMRRPNPWEAILLTWQSKPWIWSTPIFLPWDWQADEIRLRVGPQSKGHGGKRAGGKMKCITRRVEVEAGVIEHALSIATSKMNHGPNPVAGPEGMKTAPRCVLPSRRVEFPDRDPFPNNPTPAGYIPGLNFAHGQAFAHDLTDAEIEARLDACKLVGEERRTARIFVVAARDYGIEEDESGGSPDDQIETDGPMPGLTEARSMTVLDKVIPDNRWYALNPAA